MGKRFRGCRAKRLCIYRDPGGKEGLSNPNDPKGPKRATVVNAIVLLGGRLRLDERGSSEIPDPAGAGAAGLAGQRRRKGLSRSCPGVNPGTRYLPAAESTPNTRMPPPMLPLGDT